MGPSPPRRPPSRPPSRPPHRPQHPPPPGPGAGLRRRLAARLGRVAGAQPVRLSGGRSAATVRLGRPGHPGRPGAIVIKITPAPAFGVQNPTRGTHPAPPPPVTDGTPDHAVPPAARPAGPRAARAGETRDTASPLFAVDPALEGRLMAALARFGFAPAPAAMFRHGPHLCLAYPFQPGRIGHPPDAALARLLRRLHRLPPAALPPLPAPQDTAALVARAIHRLAQEPDGPALAARVTAAAQAARRAPTPATAPLHGDPVPGNVLHGPRGVRLIDWHSAHRGDPCRDLALALSPAMHVIHGLPPRTAAERADFLAAYGCAATADRLTATAALHHARMIGHCLWRLDRGDRIYGPACDAEIAALRGIPASRADPAAPAL